MKMMLLRLKLAQAERQMDSSQRMFRNRTAHPRKEVNYA
jgi:hypothetical protein